MTGGPSWLAALDGGDRAQFAAEMREALDSSVAAGDAAPLETCLREWRVTGEALSDPQRREILTGDGLGDYGEVPRP